MVKVLKLKKKEKSFYVEDGFRVSILFILG